MNIHFSGAAHHAARVHHAQRGGIHLSGAVPPWFTEPRAEALPEIVLSSAVSLVEGREVEGGIEILVFRYPWEAIIRKINEDPKFLYRALTDRQLEELVAAAYDAQGFDVTLTPPKNDGGRDVIAIHKKWGLKILDEVKCYLPDYKVGVDIVHKLHTVVELDRNASKGFVSTTSSFTAGVFERFGHLIPGKIDLRDGVQLAAFIRDSAPGSS